jgi:hypothetical protein
MAARVCLGMGNPFPSSVSEMLPSSSCTFRDGGEWLQDAIVVYNLQIRWDKDMSYPPRLAV